MSVSAVNNPGVRSATSREEIAPLVALCRAGRLFDVQQWIADGKPVDPPLKKPKGTRHQTPLEVALDAGFHSMVEVLLKAGAIQDPLVGYRSPMWRALQARRLDIVELLVEHGCDPKSVDMEEVLHSWDPRIFDYFIARDADVITNLPFARAFCDKIRTALRPFKHLLPTRPELRSQADIALRHHCKEGDIKWVSLLLWVGADPFAPGPDSPEAERGDDEDEGLSALGYAALYHHYEVFNLKPVRTRLGSEQNLDFIRYLDSGEGAAVLQTLLDGGWQPNEQENGGCSLFSVLLERFNWYGGSYSPREYGNATAVRSKTDSSQTRESLRMIHLLAKHKARWIPVDKHELTQARRGLLKMTPDYTLEFVWIMAKYQSCTRESIKALLDSPTIKASLSEHRSKLAELLAKWH